MRRKSAPPQPPPKKRARSPSAAERVAASPRALHWAHAEWFQNAIDEPYFTHSDFHAVVASRMVQLSDMLSARLTRLQLARIRAAMCNMLPGGFVQPRRFSSAFLLAEREELSMYRNDARRVLRGLDLLPSTDPTTGDTLPQNWWSRHRCAPPTPLQRGAQILVRTFSTPLNAQKLAQLHIRPAIFLSLEADSQNRIRFQDDATERIVSDLDVMLHPSSSSASGSLAHSPLPNVHSLTRSPSSPPFPFSPSVMPTPVLDFSHFPEASQSVIQLYQSPRPTLISPRKSLEVKSECAEGFECEVDFHRIAESMQLLDRKEQLLSSLRMLNDAVSTTTIPGEPPSDATQAKFDSILAALDQVNSEINMHIEPDRSTPHPSPPNLYISADMEPTKFDDTPQKCPSAAPVSLPKMAPLSPLLAKRESGSPGETMPGSPRVRPENEAKNVDFRSASGTALLAKALTKAALAKLHPENGIKSAPTPVRADVMECVSACVAVLIRARTTRDLHCIDELIEGLRSRFPANSEAIDAIHAAARVLDTSSSESA
eukprot:TRINITY_DN837_c0_g1_i1.p2 TRINITY_DN837_c0_g1~~TRINITY_DN837_c0_g1_i1.p2  ORF type:complete len:587 (+),score=91.00 TRINITY_DN837_c0_g1_i1:135-1763(+)